MRRGGRALVAGALLLAASCATREATRAERLAEGRALYLDHCVACHGADGGGGPLATYLAPPPRDLREIALRSGGVYPRSLVEAWIDGREVVGAHGLREMPVWGHALAPAGDPDAEHRVHERVDRLVEYLESIQRR